eukprot:12893238-Prorocentrum_lima.AAC.1
MSPNSRLTACTGIWTPLSPHQLPVMIQEAVPAPLIAGAASTLPRQGLLHDVPTMHSSEAQMQ